MLIVCRFRTRYLCLHQSRLPKHHSVLACLRMTKTCCLPQLSLVVSNFQRSALDLRPQSVSIINLFSIIYLRMEGPGFHDLVKRSRLRRNGCYLTTRCGTRKSHPVRNCMMNRSLERTGNARGFLWLTSRLAPLRCSGAGAQTWHLSITPNRSSLLAGRTEAEQKDNPSLEGF